MDPIRLLGAGDVIRPGDMVVPKPIPGTGFDPTGAFIWHVHFTPGTSRATGFWHEPAVPLLLLCSGVQLVRGDSRTYGLVLCGTRLGWRWDDLLERVT